MERAAATGPVVRNGLTCGVDEVLATVEEVETPDVVVLVNVMCIVVCAPTTIVDVMVV